MQSALVSFSRREGKRNSLDPYKYIRGCVECISRYIFMYVGHICVLVATTKLDSWCEIQLAAQKRDIKTNTKKSWNRVSRGLHYTDISKLQHLFVAGFSQCLFLFLLSL